MTVICRVSTPALPSRPEIAPFLPVPAKLTRQFLIRAVTLLAAEYGIRQFLDIGAGLPTANNTHEVARLGAWPSR
jgi:S-adenosyl methyltransferase